MLIPSIAWTRQSRKAYPGAVATGKASPFTSGDYGVETVMNLVLS